MLNPQTGLPEDEMPGVLPPVLNSDPAGGGAAEALAKALTPPATVDTRTQVGPSSSSTRTIATPAQEAALAAHTEAAAREVAANADVAAAKNMADAGDVFNADIELELRKKQEREHAAALADQNKRIDAAMAEEREARKVLSQKANIHSFWTEEHGGAPAQVIAAFLTGMADAAHIAHGGDGPSAATLELDKQIAANRQSQIDQFKAAELQHTLAKEGVKAAQEQAANFLKNLDQQEIIQRETMKAQIAANAAHMKQPLAEAANAKFQAEQDRKIAESEARIQGEVARKVTTQSGHETVTHTDNTGKAAGGDKVTQPERDATASLNSLTSAFEGITKNKISPDDLKKIQDNQMLMRRAEENKGALGGVVEYVGRKTEMIPRSEAEGISEEGKRAWASYKQAKANIQKLITGMAVTDKEDRDLAQRYLPQPDDTEQTLADKQAGLAREIRDRLVATGPLAAGVEARLSRAEGKPETAEAKPDKASADVYKRIAEGYQLLLDNPKMAPAKRKAIREKLDELEKQVRQ